jgi:hypothetical protein
LLVQLFNFSINILGLSGIHKIIIASKTETSGYTSAYKDRVSSYYNPYTSYDNGVTTAGLSFSTTSNPKRDYRSNLMSTSTGNLAGTSSSSILSNSQSINEKVANIGRSQSLREHERKSRSRKYKEAAKNAVPDTQIPYDTSSMSSSSALLSSAQKSLSSLSLQSEGYEVIYLLILLNLIRHRTRVVCNKISFYPSL